jgi:hypothetical protein
VVRVARSSPGTTPGNRDANATTPRRSSRRCCRASVVPSNGNPEPKGTATLRPSHENDNASASREWHEALELSAGLAAAQDLDCVYPNRRASNAVALHRPDQRRRWRLHLIASDYQRVRAVLGLRHLVFDDAWSGA